MFKTKKQMLEEKYTALFGKGGRSKQLVDFFVRRILGEIKDEELEEEVNEIQSEFAYIFATREQPQFSETIPVGETIYGKIISKEILDNEYPAITE